MGVTIEMVYKGGLRCEAIHGPSGKALATDAPIDNGGQGAEFSPTDLVATALGTCILTTMGLVADRHGLDILGASVEVVKEMTDQLDRRIGSLTVVVKMPEGLNPSDADRARLENSAFSCPVKKSLHPDVDVRIRFEY